TIFTPAFGATTGPHNKYSIIVDKGTVTQIVSGQAMIPAEGYTIVMGPNELFNRFKVGTKVDYRLEYSKIGINAGTPGEKVDWSRIRTTVGAGPTLLRNGTIIANGAAEGFLEDKINKNRGQRSFIGVTRDNILIMGTVGNVTIRELAEISQNLNLVDAINLDGGASSSLYYNGRYLTSPGRKISNALVVTRLKSVPIRLKLNGEEVFFDSDPLIINNRTLVPMRKIFEKMGVAVGYNQKTGNITAKKDDMLLELKSGSNRVMVNGKEQTMEVPLMLYNNRSYVPVRFVTEMFKGRVDWNQTDNMVILELNS
ncbi:MAG: stalk domain-containing protein, partial [Syntrophomonas sp.]